MSYKIGDIARSRFETVERRLHLLEAKHIALAGTPSVSVVTGTGLGISGSTISLGLASAGVNGAMSGAYATKLNGIATGATAEVDADGTHAGRVTLGAQVLGSGTKTVDALVSTGLITVGKHILMNGATVPSGSSTTDYFGLWLSPQAMITGDNTTGFNGFAFWANGKRNTTGGWDQIDPTRPSWSMVMSHGTQDFFSIARYPAGSTSGTPSFRIFGDGRVGINTTTNDGANAFQVNGNAIADVLWARNAFVAVATNVYFWKDATPTKQTSVGPLVPGGSVTDDLIFSLSNGVAWVEAGRFTYAKVLAIASGGNVTVGGTSVALVSGSTLASTTLTSPTINGTVGGTPTFSGAVAMASTLAVTGDIVGSAQVFGSVLWATAAFVARGCNAYFWKDATPTKQTAIGPQVPGSGVTDDIVFSLSNGSVWSEGMRLTQALHLQVAGQLRGTGGLGVGNSASGSTLGTVVKKMEVFNASGSSLGFVPIYDTIT